MVRLLAMPEGTVAKSRGSKPGSGQLGCRGLDLAMCAGAQSTLLKRGYRKQPAQVRATGDFPCPSGTKSSVKGTYAISPDISVGP
jgi:hypothetical protein